MASHPFAMPVNHPFLGAAQNMPPAPGVMPLAQPPVQNFFPPQVGTGQPTGMFPLNPGMAPGMGPGGPGMYQPQPPVSGPPGGDPHANNPNFAASQAWRSAIDAWRQGKGSATDPQAWHAARPDPRDYRPGGSAYPVIPPVTPAI